MKYSEYRESKQHGTADFPIALYRIYPSHPQYVMPLHWHREIELICVRSGHMHLHIGSSNYTAGAGDVVIVGSGALHRGDPIQCEYDCVVVDLNMLCSNNSRLWKYVQPIMNADLEIPVSLIHPDNEINPCVFSLCHCLTEQQEYYDLQVQEHLIQLLRLLHTGNRLVQSEKRLQHQGNLIANLIDWIEDNYTERITLSQLSRVCALSEKYLCRLFREFTGYTPTDYINRRRIERACHEMTVLHKSVTEAALESGFHDMSYFTKLFRRYKSMSPREYTKWINNRARQLLL